MKPVLIYNPRDSKRAAALSGEAVYDLASRDASRSNSQPGKLDKMQDRELMLIFRDSLIRQADALLALRAAVLSEVAAIERAYDIAPRGKGHVIKTDCIASLDEIKTVV